MRVAILGCGYLGLALGDRLAAAGASVVGVRRSSAGVDRIRNRGFEAVRADVTTAADLHDVPDVDALVYAVSGGRTGDPRELYVEGLRTVVEAFGARTASPDRVVYVSSTGVYGDREGEWVDEATELTPDSDRERNLVAAERVALEESTVAGIDGTAVRLAGLYGPDRYWTDRYLDGPIVEGYVNMIHRDDAAGAIAHVLDADRGRGRAINVVDDEPVSRWAFADWLADRAGRPTPEKLSREAARKRSDVSRRVLTSKRVDNARLHATGYDLSYPTYREGYADAFGGNTSDS
jgi:nucleoside-diphosphate-sugar epimerase